MKKNIYSKPEIYVVQIKTSNSILLGSGMDVDDTKVPSGLSRQARYSGWDEDFDSEE